MQDKTPSEPDKLLNTYKWSSKRQNSDTSISARGLGIVNSNKHG